MRRRDPLSNPEPLIRRVYAYVAYRVGDGAEAEDITSTTFERAVRYRDTYDSRKGEPAAWLIGIARRAIEDSRGENGDRGVERGDPASGEDVERQTVARLALGDALRGLGDRDRELIALRYAGDLTARQIAELLEMEANAVGVALHRALARLRAALEREELVVSGLGTRPAPTEL